MSRQRTSDFNYWPAVADVFMAAFMLVLILLLISRLTTVQVSNLIGDSGVLLAELEQLRSRLDQLEQNKRELETTNKDLQRKLKSEQQSRLDRDQDLAEKTRKLAEVQLETDRLRAALDTLGRDLDVLRAELRRANDRPPVIDLTDRANFRFALGSSSPTPEFCAAFERSTDIQSIPLIVKTYGVNLIEIIGHTDAVHAGGISNLDSVLGRHLTASPAFTDLPPLRFGSNADLGLMRAIEVRKLLQPRLAAWQLSHVQVRCYSAAQTVIPSGDSRNPHDYGYDGRESESKARPKLDDDARRRIEVRFTRLP